MQEMKETVEGADLHISRWQGLEQILELADRELFLYS